MSYETWHNYGYGICTSEIPESDVGRLQKLLVLAPKFHAKVEGWLKEQKITEPTWDDYMEYDQDFDLGLATILKEVIEEVEGIALNACDDYDSVRYLMYSPRYPWKLSDADRNLTQEGLKAMFLKYIGILTDREIEVEYQDAKNGG